jgi:hypothetical protein
MRMLKWICILFCLLSLVGAFSDIHGVYWSYRGVPGSPAARSTLVVTKENGFGAALASIFGALFFAGAAYGIQRRAPIVWKLGWGVLGINFLAFVIRGLSIVTKSPQPERWIFSAAILLGAAGVTAYWGVWWKRQKPYFDAVPPGFRRVIS